MGRRHALWALLLLIPLAAAQAPTEPGIYNPKVSTPATMYFHINGFQDFPVNTQIPDDRYAQTVDRGLAENSGCFELEGQTFSSRSVHTWYGYSSPSIVEYDVVNADGTPRIHQERGISYDVILDQGVTPMFSWFLEASWMEQDNMPAAPPLAPPAPEVSVRATVREGDKISVNHAAFNEGEIVAQGHSDKALLFGDMTQENEHVKLHKLGDRWVYEFTFPLTYSKGIIDRDESYNIRVDAFIDSDVCPGPGTQNDGDYFMIDHVLVHSSAQYRPRLEWAIMNPLYIEALHPQFVGDDLAIHTASNSLWGSYDVYGDIAVERPGMELEITGPTTPITFERIKIEEHTTDHYRHQEAVTAVWVWDYRADKAEKGIYNVVFNIRNDQNTAEAWAMATFSIGNSGEEVCAKNVGDADLVCTKPQAGSNSQDAPGLAPMLGLALLGLIAAIRRR